MKKITATYFARLFSRPSQNYKPIDGIRAIPVLWVIIFHAWLFQYNDFTEVGEKVLENLNLLWKSKSKKGSLVLFLPLQ